MDIVVKVYSEESSDDVVYTKYSLPNCIYAGSVIQNGNMEIIVDLVKSQEELQAAFNKANTTGGRHISNV